MLLSSKNTWRLLVEVFQITWLLNVDKYPWSGLLGRWPSCRWKLLLDSSQVDPDTGSPDACSAAIHAIPPKLTVASWHLGGSRSSYSGKLLLEQQGALSHLFFCWSSYYTFSRILLCNCYWWWLFKFELKHADIPNQTKWSAEIWPSPIHEW